MRAVKVAVTPEQAERWTRCLFGLTGKATALPGDTDRNFLLDGGPDGRWVLKVAPVGACRADVECQVEVLRFLASSDVARFLPSVRLSLGGNLLEDVEVEPGRRCFVRLVRYVEGRPVAAVGDPGAGLRAEVGALLARLDRSLVGFDHPGARRKHPWDLAGFLEIQRFRHHVDDEAGARVDEVMARFEQRVAPRFRQLRHSVIHNDANDHNILVVERSGRFSVSALIDFGDLVHTATVCELAIASAYQMMAAHTPSTVADQLRQAYESRLPLTELEREVLPILILARLSTTVVMAAQGRSMDPDDPYLTISESAARRLLFELV